MSENELMKKLDYLREIEEMAEEVKAEAEGIRDEIKQMMLEHDIEELSCGQYIVRYSDVLSNRFDTTGFKKVYGDLYKAFTKQTSSKRFTVSC